MRISKGRLEVRVPEDSPGRGQARLRGDQGRDRVAEVVESEVFDPRQPADRLDTGQTQTGKAGPGDDCQVHPGPGKARLKKSSSR